MTSSGRRWRLNAGMTTRYYHHSLVNQYLRLVSATSFLCSYVLMFVNPAVAALVASLVSMTTRQAGHFFFEPRGYDTVNQATHEHKEAIKVGSTCAARLCCCRSGPLHRCCWCSSRRCSAPSRRTRTLPNSGLTLARSGSSWGWAGCCPYGAPLLSEGRADRTGLVHEDPDGPLPRREALPQGAAVPHPRGTAGASDGDGGAALTGARPKRARSISRVMRRLIARLVSSRALPPPAIHVHCSRACHDPLSHDLEIRVRVIEAEDESARADPAEGESLRTQIELQHPVVARWAGVAHGSRSSRGCVPAAAGQRR